jgi:thiol-disulfide isomerase/thioredoxin
MKSKLFLVLLMVAGLAYFLYIYQGPERTRVGSIAPLFSAAGRSTAVKFEDYRGQVVLLNFWATWCPPCVHEMPSLEGLHQQLKERILKFSQLASMKEGGGP